MLPSIGLVIAACCLDRLIGDPRWCLHPVQVMGAVIQQLRLGVEAIAGERPWALRLGGGLITDDTKAEMKRILADIQDGTFAKNFVAECEAGKPEMNKIRKRDGEHKIEEVGKGLRSMFSWLKAS